MSVAVSLDQLRDRITEYGGFAYLVTVGADSNAHVVSVAARMDGDRVIVSAGTTSRANVEANQAVTVLWPSRPGGDYSLIVDGDATVSDDELVLVPTRAVLHRVANAGDNVPSCVRLED